MKTQRLRSKWCRPCRRWHARSAFGRDASSRDGLAGVCRASRAARLRADRRPERGSGRSAAPWLPEAVRRARLAMIAHLDREWLDVPLGGRG